MKLRAKRIMTGVALGLTVLLLAQLVEFFSFRSSQNALALERAAATAEAFKSEVGSLMSRVEAEGRALGEEFASRDASEGEVRDHIRDAALEFAEIRGVTACYEPFAFDPATRLFCPYYNKATGDYLQVEDSYDYTTREPGTLWYGSVVDEGAKWSEPYYGSGAQEWFVDYGVPFAFASGDRAGEVQGIVDLSLEANDFQTLVHDLIVGKARYSFITSPEGMFVSHPEAGYVGVRTLQDAIANDTISPVLKRIFEGLASGEQEIFTIGDATARDRVIVHVDRLKGAGFGIATAYYQRDLIDSERPRQRRFINIALTLSLILIIGSIRYFARDGLDRDEIEGLSIAATVILLINVLFIGALKHGQGIEITPNDSVPIVDMTALGGLVDAEEARADELKIDPPLLVPTGIYIERLEFADSYNVNVGGVVWQKYPLDRVDEVEIGVRLPQVSPFAEAEYIEESYRRTVEGKAGETGYLLVGYDIRTTLRLNVSYRDYPFDQRHLDIRLAPVSRTDNVMLVPDLGGYTDTAPSSRAGIDPDIELPGNYIVETYYNFTFEEYDTDFGFAASGHYSHIPLLHFNIHQKRYLINAFVTYLIPIFVVLAMIYILILASEKTEARQGIIESMAAFFFVLIFSHIDLRKTIVTADLMFMEYFYFATYAMIVLATFNLITYTRSRVALFDYNDNQIFRAVYFPLFLTIVLVVMLARFY